MSNSSRALRVARKQNPLRTRGEGPKTVEEYLASGRHITQCPPGLPHDLIGWDVLGDRILGASYEDLDTPTSRWHLSADTRAAMQEAQQPITGDLEE